MILQLLQIILLTLFPKRNEPVRLSKKQEVKAPLMDRTFILIALALTLFFLIALGMALSGISMVESGQVYNMGY